VTADSLSRHCDGLVEKRRSGQTAPRQMVKAGTRGTVISNVSLPESESGAAPPPSGHTAAQADSRATA
jgi:hypothetical protein